jgi:hypothetical protein
MYNMNTVHRCNNCNTKWNTKKTYDLHAAMCNLIHTSAKDRDVDHEIELPSQAAMFHYILHLTNKYEDLEKKIAKIQSSTTRFRRKHIEDYLQSLSPPKWIYSDWLSSIEVADYHLQKVFEHDLEECIKQVLTPLLSDLPIRAFTQKPSVFYIFDSEWRLMTAEEFTSFVKSLSHKVLRTYTKWARDHHAEMHANTKMQELAMVYMSKVNGMNHSIETRSSIIKKWLFTKIAVSLNHVDF